MSDNNNQSENNMLGTILGAATAVGVTYYLMSKSAEGERNYAEQNLLRAQQETERVRKEKAQAEGEISKLEQENTDLRKKFSAQGDNVFDLEDNLEDEQRKSARLEAQLEQALREIQEYKEALQAAEQEIAYLKKQ